MRGLAFLAAVGFWSTLAIAQSTFPMQYIDEIGHIDGVWWWDQRKSADLGQATVFAEGEVGNGDDLLRFEGRDDAGKPWRLWIPRVAGLGNTEVYRADFDDNKRTDLLISMSFPQNGRCIDEFELLFLLFDDRGRPGVTKITTHGFSGLETPPAIVLDVNRDGRAEVAINQCGYSDYPRHGEDRQITGVYEAREGQWIPLRSMQEASYRAAAQVGYKQWLSPGADILWLPMDASTWPDSLGGTGDSRFGPHRLELNAE